MYNSFQPNSDDYLLINIYDKYIYLFTGYPIWCTIFFIKKSHLNYYCYKSKNKVKNNNTVLKFE